MKSLIVGLFVIFANLSFADQRFTDKEREDFLKEARMDAQEFKADNQGKFDLQLLKPYIIQALDEQRVEGNLTKQELKYVKDELEKYAKVPENNGNEEKLFKMLSLALAEVSKKPIIKTKEGQICNETRCEDGLKCANDPLQYKGGLKCAPGAVACSSDADCCSDTCVEQKGSGRKTCAPVKRCYLPIKNSGASCAVNPVCESGSCLPFNSNTIGVGECQQENTKCANNDDCCTGLCSGGICKENLVCKDCATIGKNAGDKKCCEGLYKNEAGVCIPDVKPIVPPQVNNTKKTLINIVASFFIDSAFAGEAYDTINGNRSAYENFNPKKNEKDTVDLKKASANLGFSLKSNFQTCDMHFRQDFYAYLIKNKLFDQEVALLAFDYMMLGEPNEDYWRTSKSNGETSINGRLKKMAEKHAEIRATTNTKIDEINRKLTCMCIDVIGVDKIGDDNKVQFFNKSCGDFKKSYKGDQNNASCANLEGEKKSYAESCSGGADSKVSAADCAKLKTALDEKTATCAATPDEPKFLDDVKDGDASGVKAKRMLVYFTAQMSAFNQELAIDNTKVYEGIADVRDWMTEDGYEKLNSNETKTINLGEFTIEGSGNQATAIGAAVLGALLAAGVIAVLGGFATGSMISTWVSVGIITAAAAASGAGVWMVASLKGAWVAKRPMVADQFLRYQSCGKKGKNSCTDWRRNLTQPYNNICDAHISASACVKNFLAYKSGDEFRYIVDPFIPYGVSKSGLLRNQVDHAKNLDAGYQRALSSLRGKARTGMTSQSYMWEDFLDEAIVGQYAPDLGSNPEGTYLLNENNINEIKEKAKKFAIESKFLTEDETENLEKFANYAYEFHFMWPRTTFKEEVSYPTVALDTYLDFMSNGVAAKLSAGGTNAALTFGGLNSKYLQDYLNTLQLYEQQANNLDDAAKNSLKAEIAKTQAAIASNKLLNSLIATGTDFSALSKDALSNFASQNGANGATLSGTQADFAKAVGTYRKLRNAQVKKLDAYNKAVAKGEIGKSRAASVSKATSSFASKFTSPMTASLGKGSSGLFGSGSGTDAVTEKAKEELQGFTIPNGGMDANGASFGGIPNFSGGGSGSGKSSMGSGSGSGNGSASAGSGDDEDSKKLSEAVEARDSTKGKYQSSDANTLFEKVTNAYIRNYDKVLTRKNKEKENLDKKE